MNLEDIQSIIENKPAVMLYFWGEDCAVCDALKPKIKELLDNNFPKIEQIYIDAKNNTNIAANFNVFAIPTTIIFLDGKEFLREGRNVSIVTLKDKLERVYNLFFNN